MIVLYDAEKLFGCGVTSVKVSCVFLHPLLYKRILKNAYSVNIENKHKPREVVVYEQWERSLIIPNANA